MPHKELEPAGCSQACGGSRTALAKHSCIRLEITLDKNKERLV